MSNYILVNPESLKNSLNDGHDVSTAIIFSAIPANKHHIAHLEEENARLRRQLEERDGQVLMPAVLTSENGAKYAMMGEFHEVVELECTACDGDNEDCDVCEGNGAYNHHVTVSWSTIKDIYKRAVQLFNG